MIALVIVSLLMTVTFWQVARYRKPAHCGTAFIIWFVLLFVIEAPTTLWLNLLGLAIVAAAVSCTTIKARWCAVCCLMPTALAYSAIAAHYADRYRQLVDLRNKYPPVSVADRLKNEHIERQESPSDLAASDGRESGENSRHLASIVEEVSRLEARLESYDESGWKAQRREWALAALNSIHDRIVTEFTYAQGFGVTRMRLMPVNETVIAIPELPPLALPAVFESDADESPGAAGELRDQVVPVAPAPAAETNYLALRAAHEAGVFDFANPNGFGFIASREKVFGFQSHGFRALPDLTAAGGDLAQWQIANLELVSLLLHETPAAYVSANLPRMEELADTRTRPLDQFETSALGKLRLGEEIVVDQHADEMRMLGSLRAAKKCTECHAVSRGDLLGAFTYRLRRGVPPHKKPALDVKPVL